MQEMMGDGLNIKISNVFCKLGKAKKALQGQLGARVIMPETSDIIHIKFFATAKAKQKQFQVEQ